jgi:RNA polymerase sigma-70 factor, ECF subfamily
MLMTTASSLPDDSSRPYLGARRPANGPATRPRQTADRELVEQLQHGDPVAYETLVRQHGGAMLAVARRMLRHEEDARDAVQDAFLQAFRAIRHFRAEARLSTWLHRIIMNAALMRLRSASRRPEAAIDELLPRFDDEGCHAEHIRPLPVGIESVLESAQTRAQVRRCVEQLPERYRAVIVLRDLQELTTAETATVLGITENAVKIRLHRAHQSLRTLLLRQLPEHD